jgi:hypothetical protein
MARANDLPSPAGPARRLALSPGPSVLPGRRAGPRRHTGPGPWLALAAGNDRGGTPSPGRRAARAPDGVTSVGRFKPERRVIARPQRPPGLAGRAQPASGRGPSGRGVATAERATPTRNLKPSPAARRGPATNSKPRTPGRSRLPGVPLARDSGLPETDSEPGRASRPGTAGARAVPGRAGPCGPPRSPRRRHGRSESARFAAAASAAPAPRRPAGREP